MYKKINLQFLFSYLGLLPYLIIIFDKFFLYQIDVNILKNFSSLYSIVILVFIGSINWNLNAKVSIRLILYGFLPSLYSVIIIIIYLYGFSVYIFLIFFFLLQLVLDYFLIYKNAKDQTAYYGVRLPLTILIVLSLIFIQ